MKGESRRPRDVGAVLIEPLDGRAPLVAARIHAIQMLAYEQERAILGVVDFPPLRRTIADIVASSESFLGASLDQDLVGVIGIEPHAERATRLISSLVVHPAQQRRGVGRRLVCAAIARNPSEALVVSTGAKNERAIRLYDSLGFTETSRVIVGSESLELIRMRRQSDQPG